MEPCSHPRHTRRCELNQRCGYTRYKGLVRQCVVRPPSDISQMAEHATLHGHLFKAGPVWLRNCWHGNKETPFLSCGELPSRDVLWLAPHAQEWELFTFEPSYAGTVKLRHVHFGTFLCAKRIDIQEKVYRQAVKDYEEDLYPTLWVVSHEKAGLSDVDGHIHEKAGANADWELNFVADNKVALKNKASGHFLSAQSHNKRPDARCEEDMFIHKYFNRTSMCNGVYLTPAAQEAEMWLPLVRGEGSVNVLHFGRDLETRNVLA